MRSTKKIRREPDVGKIIDRTIVRLWDTIEELEALTPAELRFYRVAVFGSARLKSPPTPSTSTFGSWRPG